MPAGHDCPGLGSRARLRDERDALAGATGPDSTPRNSDDRRLDSRCWIRGARHLVTGHLVTAASRPPLASGSSLHRGAVLLDVLLHRFVIELEVAEHAGIGALELRRLLLPAEPEAHLQHRSPEQPVLQRFRLPHPEPPRVNRLRGDHPPEGAAWASAPPCPGSPPRAVDGPRLRRARSDRRPRPPPSAAGRAPAPRA